MTPALIKIGSDTKPARGVRVYPFHGPFVVQVVDRFQLNLRGQILDCRPGEVHVMGILNVTPDSFSDGGAYLAPGPALARAEEMVHQGATLIDVGGASSRPSGAAYGAGATPVSAQQELDRILPVVQGIMSGLPGTLLSVDTFQEEVARAALDEGVHLINDVTGLRHSPSIAALVGRAGAGMVIMHSRGFVGAMPHIEHYDDVVVDVAQFLRSAASMAAAAGVNSVILDPGFGFGKSVRDNLRLVDRMDALIDLGYPALIGVSRKSSIGAALGTLENPAPAAERLFGSLGATAVAVMRGASIVRTHDVRETVQMLRVMGKTLRSNVGSADANSYLEGPVRRSPPNTAST